MARPFSRPQILSFGRYTAREPISLGRRGPGSKRKGQQMPLLRLLPRQDAKRGSCVQALACGATVPEATGVGPGVALSSSREKVGRSPGQPPASSPEALRGGLLWGRGLPALHTLPRRVSEGLTCAAAGPGPRSDMPLGMKPTGPGKPAGTHSGQGFLDVLSGSRNVSEDHAGAILL